MIHDDGAGQVRHWRELLASERDAAALYTRIASVETGERRSIFEELAAVERRHAAYWEDKIRGAGQDVPPPGRPSLRTRLLAAAARRLSPGAVLPLIERAERADAGVYDDDPDAAPGMAADEHGHARTIAKLIEGGRPSPRAQIGRRELWHRGDRSGALRAGVFGVSDGLVSNTALVMGVAGSGASHTVILLTGTAGLLSGSFSMAAGEYGSGTAALVAAIVLAAAAVVGVGAGIGVLNGRSPIRSGLRQLLLGGAAALVTFGIGHLIGASVS